MGVAPISVPQSLAYVLNSAGSKSNVDFDYLLQTAVRESSLNPEAKASTSSAVGLFQFIESTWLQVLKEQGPRLGYSEYANAITRDGNGDYVIRDKAQRQKILALREDPQMAADLAAAFTQSNGAYLESKFGRMPSPGELYIAHFLGPQGAEKLFQAGLADPNQIAAKLFPRQAKANPSLFYADSQPRTIKELYRALVAKHDGAPAAIEDSRFATQQIAAGEQQRWSTDVVPSRFGTDDMSFTSFFSTEAPTAAPQPLIATDALQSLVSADVYAPMAYAANDQIGFGLTDKPMDLGLGFDPLPAPEPLAPPGATAALSGTPLTANSSVPAPRVLMTGAPGNSAFLTQLIVEQ